jgi:hypothetical protein
MSAGRMPTNEAQLPSLRDAPPAYSLVPLAMNADVSAFRGEINLGFQGSSTGMHFDRMQEDDSGQRTKGSI